MSALAGYNTTDVDGTTAVTQGTPNAAGFMQPTGTDGGTNNPQINAYTQYRDVVNGRRDGLGTTAATTKSARAFTWSGRSDTATVDQLKTHLYDPWGAASRGVTGRQYESKGWVNPYDFTAASGDAYYDATAGFKYNQMLVTMSENFDPFIQKKTMENQRWWITRIPRGAYTLFDGLVHQTNIFRGGLTTYAGLYDWEELMDDPTQKDPCGPRKWRTYDYAWETRAWSGKATAWGSDPFCFKQFRFMPKALEQLGWIIEQGAKFGLDIQNVWNRDMFIYHSVMAGRSYVMSKEYRGTSSARFVYEPFCKFVTDGQESALNASKAYVDKPFIVIDATYGGPECVNFESLQLLRRELNMVCPEAAVGTVGNSKLFAIGISADDLDNYIRGNEEERKNYLEGDPSALIKGWDMVPTTFRRWLITEDGDQLRFKYKAYIPQYSDGVAKKYGYVGYKEMADKPVFICEFVPPVRGGKVGINGAAIPEANPDYDLAEVAIAPIFINNVFTNLFVPSTPVSIPGGATFGTVGGLNGQWRWYNVPGPQNPENDIGNFRGVFEIVPKPNTCATYATSFVYRRCAQPLESLCPVQNASISPAAKATSSTVKTGTVSGSLTADIVLKTVYALVPGDLVKVTGKFATIGLKDDDEYDAVKVTAAETTTTSGGTTTTKTTYTYVDTTAGKTYSVSVSGATAPATQLASDTTFYLNGDISSSDTKTLKYVAAPATAADYTAMVYSSPTQLQKSIQFTSPVAPGESLVDATVTKTVG